MSSPRAELLREAERLVTGDRNNQYGPPTQDFDRTAAILTGMGLRMVADEGDEISVTELEGHHVALIMAALKLSRLCWQADKRDSWADLAGYAACGWECVDRPGGEEATTLTAGTFGFAPDEERGCDCT